jgi:type III restriction enzyme
MQLKPYQQTVLADVRRYVALLDEGRQAPGAAFAAFWATHPVWPLDVAAPAPERAVKPYQTLKELARTPQVTIKVPTGGGKTYLACHALAALLAEAPAGTPRLAVWLVPSLVIRDQTLRALRHPAHPYRQALNAAFGSRVEVIDKDELAQGRGLLAAGRGEQLTVAVLSLDSLRTANPDNRKAYDENSNNLPFVAAFAGRMVPPVLRPDGTPTDATATFNVLRTLAPVVIIDESHHAKTTLSDKLLVNLGPRFVLELTATPRPTSNLLSLVSAQALKLEHMVKLPVLVHNHHRKEDVLLAAKALQERLEAVAKAAQRTQGAYAVRPIVLLQAEARTGHEAEDYDKVKAALRKMGIPEEQIKIKVSGKDELAGLDLLSPKCPVRYIITVNALAEGWDCSFAYVLASLANRNSAVQVEQLLGRVLRQPHATPHPERLLNCSYVLSASKDFQATLANIVQGLKLAGYTAADHRAIEAAEAAEPVASGGQGVLAFGASDELDIERLVLAPPSAGTSPPGPLSKKEGEPNEFGTDSFASTKEASGSPSFLERGPGGEVPAPGDTASTPAEQAVAEIEAQALLAAAEAEAIAAAATHDPSTDPSPVAHQAHTYPMRPAVAAAAQALRLPVFVVDGPGGLFSAEMELSKEYLLKGFDLSKQSTALDFRQAAEAWRQVDLEENADHSYTPTVRKADAQLKEPLLAYFRQASPERQRQDAVNEVFKSIGRSLRPVGDGEVRAYIDKLLRDFDVEQLREAFQQPGRYAQVVREAIEGFTQAYAVQAFERQLDTGKLRTAPAFALPARRVAPDPALPLPRTLYAQEQNGNGPERALMQLLADAENVTWWTRNPPNALAGFRLNGPLAGHFPDFIACTEKGKILLIESKGDDRNNEDSAYKRRLGAAWATAAGPGYKYYMVFDKLEVAGAQRLGTFGGLLAEL